MPAYSFTFLRTLLGASTVLTSFCLLSGEWSWMVGTKRFACQIPDCSLLRPHLSLCLKPSKQMRFPPSAAVFILQRPITGFSHRPWFVIIKQTWHNSFLAVVALGGIIVGMTLSAQQQIILGCKCFLHQRAATLGTVETLVMPMTILVRQILWINHLISLSGVKSISAERGSSHCLTLPCSCSQSWESSLRSSWQTGCRNTLYSTACPLSWCTFSPARSLCSNGSRNARRSTFWVWPIRLQIEGE